MLFPMAGSSESIRLRQTGKGAFIVNDPVVLSRGYRAELEKLKLLHADFRNAEGIIVIVS